MPTEKHRDNSGTIPHGPKPKPHNQSGAKGPSTRSELGGQRVPMKRQIEDYAVKTEERYNQIATHQKNTHTFAELASKVREWEKTINGKGNEKGTYALEVDWIEKQEQYD